METKEFSIRYNDDDAVAYVATRMPAVYSAAHRVLREVFLLALILFSNVVHQSLSWKLFFMSFKMP